MKYRLRIPDLSLHDETTCGGYPHCKITEDRARWDAAHPIVQTTTTELEAARTFRQRFPDAIGQPQTVKIGGVDTVIIYFASNEEEVRRASMLKQRLNPCAIIELVPEDRRDRKDIKAKRVLDKHLWFQGWVPDMKDTRFQRDLMVRSSLTVGPQKLPVHFGPEGDNWLLQIPGAISFELTDEFVAQIVGEYVRKHGKVAGIKAEVIPNGP